MFWKRSFRIRAPSATLLRFKANEFAEQFRAAMNSRKLEFDTEFKDDLVKISIIFHDETSETAPLLDKALLTRIISDLLQEQDFLIELHAGGMGWN